MAERIFIKGNDALALGALRSGLQFFAGYPITPASEIPEYLAQQYQEDQLRSERGETPLYPGFVFLQAESEIASINMVLGASATGARAMSASSSPGISLKTEGISYLHGSELPAVVVNIMRGGPGLGNIAPQQGDYLQAVKGGGHGDYQNLVLAPGSVQEMHDFMPLAFDLAFRYRTVVMVIADSCLGQMKESIVEGRISPSDRHSAGEWCLDRDSDRKRRMITSLRIEPEALERHILDLKAKYDLIAAREVRAETYLVEDAELVCVAYGICARIAKGAIHRLRRNGIRVGLIRPQTLWPFPSGVLREAAERARAFLAVELSLGQMAEDVRLAVNGAREVEVHHRLGGMIPSVREVEDRIASMVPRYR